MKVRRASLEDLEAVVLLFDGYRQFYQQASDVAGARNFLQARMANEESVIFVAEAASGSLVGFTQLFPSFTSVGMKTSWILNDLYVAPEHRQQAYGEALLKHAVQFSKDSGARNLSLQTALTNTSAQRLYQKMGWRRDEKYFTYYYFHAEHP